MKLQISSNEKPYKEIIRDIKAFYDQRSPDSYEIVPLEIGDFQKGNAVIELKSASDLISSMKKEPGTTTSRLIRQVNNMTQFKCPVVLVTATIPEIVLESRRTNTENPFRFDSLIGYLASIYVRYGVPVIPFGQLGAAYFAYSVLEKANDGKVPIINPLKASAVATPPQEQESVLMGIKGIGPEIAASLLLHFSSLNNIFNATEKQLTEIDGIGPKTAKKIYELIRRKYA